MEAINDNVNGVSYKETPMIINDNDKPVENCKSHHTEYIADKLVQAFNAPHSRNFFLKCAWRLPESTIWNVYESSQRKEIYSPIKYFVKSCSNEMNKKIIGRI